MANKFCVSITHAKDNTDKATVGFVVANAAVGSGRLRAGILHECVKSGVPFVLAGSLRDDGPLPETITDMNQAQDAYAEQLRGAGVVLCLGTMLHSIATGNMLPSWVKIVCVDINPAVATKVSDRGTGQAGREQAENRGQSPNSGSGASAQPKN